MIVTLNNFNINDYVSPAYLDNTANITGLDLPSIRTSSGNYAGRAGGYLGAQFPGMRDIGLQGRLFSSDNATIASVRKAFQTALTANYDGYGYAVNMQVVDNAGNSYLIYAYLIDFEMPINGKIFSAPFNISLLAPDPVIYDNATGTALFVSVPKLTAGGYTYPVVYPVVYAAGSPPTSVNNSGTVAVYPIITLTGSATNPTLTNGATNAFFGLNLTTGPSDVITIDMRQRTVLLNGGSIFNLQSSGSSFWSLVKGTNPISLQTSSGSDTVSATVSWRSGFMGI